MEYLNYGSDENSEEREDCGRLGQSGKVFSFFWKNKTWLEVCGNFHIGTMGVGMEAEINTCIVCPCVNMCLYVY